MRLIRSIIAPAGRIRAGRIRAGRLAALPLLALLAGCGSGGSDLLNFGNTTAGPDEFLILPTKPLQTPPDYALLPPPEPGAPNLVDPVPDADAIAALGGRPAVLARPSTDGALLAYATRGGLDPAIRSDLAAVDAAYRGTRRGRLLERLFGVNRYYDAYDAQALDQRAELERIRARGIATPAAPPEGFEAR